MKRFLTALLLAPLQVYRRWISPGMAPRCRYYPTCSAYAAQAIREVGPIRGSILAAWRLLRCNPFSSGGIDEVADRPFFRDRAHGHDHHDHGPTGAGAAERPT